MRATNPWKVSFVVDFGCRFFSYSSAPTTHYHLEHRFIEK